MTASLRVPFAVRLELAHAELARGDAGLLPTSVVDQLVAATADGMSRFGEVAARFSEVDPERWEVAESVVATRIPVEASALLLAALYGMACCEHVRGSGPQPLVARLPSRYVDCRACFESVRRPGLAAEDQCDFCDARGVVLFTPLMLSVGPVLYIGDACQGCAGVLQSRPSEGSA